MLLARGSTPMPQWPIGGGGGFEWVVESTTVGGPYKDNRSYMGPLDIWPVTNHIPYCGVPNISNIPNGVNDMAC